MKKRIRQAFAGSRKSIYLVPPDKDHLIVIGVDQGDETHPLYDARITWPLKENIIVGMMKHGVKTPINVLKDGARGIVVAGRRRVLHAREANRRLKAKGLPPINIPVNPPETDDERENLELVIIENEHRETDSPVNLAKKLKRYCDMGHTDHQAAVAFNIPLDKVKARKKLLELDRAVLKAVDADKISETAAVELHGLSKDEQRDKLKEMLESGDGKATVRKARKAAKEVKTGVRIEAVPRRVVRAAFARASAGELALDHISHLDDPSITEAAQRAFAVGIGVAIGKVQEKDLPAVLRDMLTKHEAPAASDAIPVGHPTESADREGDEAVAS